jgi:methylmalonyl-CoA mutase N-terminal domain/subunit
VESGERAVVGVTTFVDDGDAKIPTLYIDESTEQKQLDQLQLLKRKRDTDRVARALEQVRAAADGTTNMMEPLLDAVRVYATLGEMCNALRDVWGEYEETPMI